MTKDDSPPRCRYCRRPLPPPGPTGRPARYCRRTHRQRAYEARRLAQRAELLPGQVVVAQVDLDRLHDRLYALEAALEDVAGDLTGRPGLADYRAALEHLRQPAGELSGLVIEPALV